MAPIVNKENDKYRTIISSNGGGTAIQDSEWKLIEKYSSGRMQKELYIFGN